MNIKALALASTIALGSILGSVAPAQARASSCWIMRAGTRRAPAFRCDVTRRINANGHTVWDITHFQGNGARFTVVMWSDYSAEVLINGERLRTTVNTDKAGDHWIDLGSYGSFIFST